MWRNKVGAATFIGTTRWPLHTGALGNHYILLVPHVLSLACPLPPISRRSLRLWSSHVSPRTQIGSNGSRDATFAVLKCRGSGITRGRKGPKSVHRWAFNCQAHAISARTHRIREDYHVVGNASVALHSRRLPKHRRVGDEAHSNLGDRRLREKKTWRWNFLYLDGYTAVPASPLPSESADTKLLISKILSGAISRHLVAPESRVKDCLSSVMKLFAFAAAKESVHGAWDPVRF